MKWRHRNDRYEEDDAHRPARCGSWPRRWRSRPAPTRRARMRRPTLQARRRPAASRISWSMSATACSSKPTPTELTPQSRRDAGQAGAVAARTTASYAFTIEGHADERGTREYNIALGARRAQAVRDYLDLARHRSRRSACARSPTARSARSRSATTSRAGRRTAAPSPCWA